MRNIWAKALLKKEYINVQRSVERVNECADSKPECRDEENSCFCCLKELGAGLRNLYHFKYLIKHIDAREPKEGENEYSCK